jgi:hypothetical protein
LIRERPEERARNLLKRFSGGVCPSPGVFEREAFNLFRNGTREKAEPGVPFSSEMPGAMAGEFLQRNFLPGVFLFLAIQGQKNRRAQKNPLEDSANKERVF